jgi:hypothetical protein
VCFAARDTVRNGTFRQVRWLVGRCDRSWQRLAEGESHGGDFLLLLDDDFLRDAPQLLVATVAQFGLSHVNRTLMVRNHHGSEIMIDITGVPNVHASHYLVHGCLILDKKRRFARRACTGYSVYRRRCGQRDSQVRGAKQTNASVDAYASTAT